MLKKRKPATKIAKQRRKNNRSPIRKSKVTCCFAGLAGYSCHTGGLDIQARYHVPEAEKKKNNFSKNASCFATCYRYFRDLHAFQSESVCENCELLPGPTSGGWMKFRFGADILLLCSKCHNRESKKRQRRDEGVMERRKGRWKNGDW